MGASNGVTLRRIVYMNPEDDATYTYLTNDNTLPACQIVLLYKHRWDIEKIFHQFKSKMSERKSWASSLQAKQIHAIFECLAHNLPLLFEQYLSQTEGVRDEIEENKQQGRAKGGLVVSMAQGVIRVVRNFINTALTRATQRTQRFIRWVRVGIYKQAPWSDSIVRLREVWAGDYLSFSTPIHSQSR
ncbi:MAG: transposase [Gloeobacteraceae cyanobacterium ES-bin-144]|nr:transposase [Verrucomicrobiales bacterium]